jgi:hypothetical protein
MGATLRRNAIDRVQAYVDARQIPEEESAAE